MHAPDYADENNVLNIFSESKKIKKNSLGVLMNCIKFCKDLNKFKSKPISLVVSFSKKEKNITKEKFFNDVKKFIDYIMKKFSVNILPQWLPPFAWYFGGSVPVDVFSHPDDLKLIKKHKIKICMDLSHFIMSCNYYNLKPNKYLKLYENHFSHYHFSDANGFDGEGVLLGKGDLLKRINLKKIFNKKKLYVLETWQGHILNCENFKKDINYLIKNII